MASWERIALRAEAEIKVLKSKIARMSKKQEPIPMYKLHTFVYMQGVEVYILSTNTYCNKCDRFLDEVKYTLKEKCSEKVHHGIPESKLSFTAEG